MSAPITSELAAFNEFVVNHLPAEHDRLTLEEGISAFREYQRQLERCRVEVGPAIAELDSGAGTDLDIEEIIQEGREILAAEGIIH